MRTVAASVHSPSNGAVTVVAASLSLLSLLSAPVAVRADCSTTAWEPNCNIYLYKLDRSDFLVAFLQFGIPCVTITHRAHTQTDRLRCGRRPFEILCCPR